MTMGVRLEHGQDHLELVGELALHDPVLPLVHDTDAGVARVQVQSHIMVGLHGSPPFANLFFVLKGAVPGDFGKLSLKQSKSWT
jgi:hypothetical protein